MPKKNDLSSKVSGVKASQNMTSVERLTGVGNVERTEKTTAVSAVRGLSGVGKARSIGSISSANKEALYNMLHEEADKLFGKTNFSKQKRDVIERAVKMAIDAAASEDDSTEKTKKKFK